MLARPCMRALGRARAARVSTATAAACRAAVRPALASGYATVSKGTRHEETSARSAVINVLQNLGSKRE
jgi:N-acetyl-gamma-glutamyl-phosphate reductase/acetylglutamate kinase